MPRKKKYKPIKLRPMEFSKKILIVAAITNFIVIFFTILMVYETKDLSPLTYLIPSVGAEVASATAFYYAKAKTENKIKLMKQYGVEPTPESFKEGF